jgi:hypothetical protein
MNDLRHSLPEEDITVSDTCMQNHELTKQRWTELENGFVPDFGVRTIYQPANEAGEYIYLYMG